MYKIIVPIFAILFLVIFAFFYRDSSLKTDPISSNRRVLSTLSDKFCDGVTIPTPTSQQYSDFNNVRQRAKDYGDGENQLITAITTSDMSSYYQWLYIAASGIYVGGFAIVFLVLVLFCCCGCCQSFCLKIENKLYCKKLDKLTFQKRGDKICSVLIIVLGVLLLGGTGLAYDYNKKTNDGSKIAFCAIMTQISVLLNDTNQILPNWTGLSPALNNITAASADINALGPSLASLYGSVATTLPTLTGSITALQTANSAIYTSNSALNFPNPAPNNSTVTIPSVFITTVI